jgi:hypothetical protein
MTTTNRLIENLATSAIASNSFSVKEILASFMPSFSDSTFFVELFPALIV